MTFVPECPNKGNFPSVFTPAQVSQLYSITGAEEMISVPSDSSECSLVYTLEMTHKIIRVFFALHIQEKESRQNIFTTSPQFPQTATYRVL